MSIEAAIEFRAMINETPALQSAVRELMDEEGILDLQETAKLGQQHGYAITASEVETLIANDNDELSDFELEMVSAGLPVNTSGGNGGIR